MFKAGKQEWDKCTVWYAERTIWYADHFINILGRVLLIADQFCITKEVDEMMHCLLSGMEEQKELR